MKDNNGSAESPPKAKPSGGAGLLGVSSASANASSVSVLQTDRPSSDDRRVRVSYLTEQTSHHPPVSAFYISCPERGLHARGFDQITAKFTGTSIKVMPGEHNLGIFITLERRGHETYQLTHPAAHLGGLLRGALSVSVGDVAYVTCPETRIKAILHYYEEGWLGRSTNKVEGVVFRYDPDKDDKTKIKDVPDDDVLIRLGGSWKERIIYTLGPKPVVSISPVLSSTPLIHNLFVRPRAIPPLLIQPHTGLLTSASPEPQDSHPPSEQTTIIDIGPLSVAPKCLPPVEQMLEHESLRQWAPVTEAIMAKQFALATQKKVEIEERQRELARERERASVEWTPAYFAQVTGNGGKPELTDKGREVLARAQREEWSMEGIA